MMKNRNAGLSARIAKLRGTTILNSDSFAIDSRSAGFTILELTISIAMLGLIVLIILGALRLGHRSIESGEKKIEALERMRASFNIIDSQIQSFSALTYNDDMGVKKYYFIGKRGLLQFSTNYSVWGGEKGYVVATYTVVPAENGKQFLYVSEHVVGLEQTRETKLFDHFDTIYFEYFYKDPTEETGKWVDEWTKEESIPEKVKIHLVEGTKDLTLIVPLRIKTSLTGQDES
jgi:general secretion pathway protein J